MPDELWRHGPTGDGVPYDPLLAAVIIAAVTPIRGGGATILPRRDRFAGGGAADRTRAKEMRARKGNARVHEGGPDVASFRV